MVKIYEGVYWLKKLPLFTADCELYWSPKKQRIWEQAGAELCQAQHSLSLDLDTN